MNSIQFLEISSFYIFPIKLCRQVEKDLYTWMFTVIKCVTSKSRKKILSPSIRKGLNKLWINSTMKFHVTIIMSKVDMNVGHGRL